MKTPAQACACKNLWKRHRKCNTLTFQVQTQVDFFPREIITWQVREPITEVEHESRWSNLLLVTPFSFMCWNQYTW